MRKGIKKCIEYFRWLGLEECLAGIGMLVSLTGLYILMYVFAG